MLLKRFNRNIINVSNADTDISQIKCANLQFRPNPAGS
jgi:hypothetical protein